MWSIKTLHELSATEWHHIVKERIKVFVVEQTSSYQEVDDYDLEAVHIYKKDSGQLKAYARLFEKDGKITFGRVLLPKEGRGEGNGRKLLETVLAYARAHYPNREIEIQAEAYLKDFYASFGFKIISDKYLDYDIEHYDMAMRI